MTSGNSGSPEVFSRIADALERDWSVLARPTQLPPSGDWRIWVALAGRGWGKTRTGSEWVKGQVEAGAARRIALVAPTAADARDVMVEGESGVLAVAPAWNRPLYEPSKRRLTWPNGAIATTYSADEPERLRGPQHDAAWCDELASWRYPDAWDQLQLGLRIGKNPRIVVTATPKPVRLIRELLAREGREVVVTRGRTVENEANLAPTFLRQVLARYEGTRLGRQELDAEVLEDVPGALWSREMIERARVQAHPSLSRVVVAIDPAGSSNENSDETGIVVCGTDGRGHGYVLADLSGRFPPEAWARRAVAAYHAHRADRIVAESNFGGEMVRATVRAVDSNVPLKLISSSRGKVLRAEPISAFYEQGRIHHVGAFPDLEDQQCAFTSDHDRVRDGSPDRVDGLVFGLTELLGRESGEAVLDYFRGIGAGIDVKRLAALAKMGEKTLAPASLGVNLSAAASSLRLKAEPHQAFMYGAGRRFTAGADGIIDRDIAGNPLMEEDALVLISAGCSRLPSQGE